MTTLAEAPILPRRLQYQIFQITPRHDREYTVKQKLRNARKSQRSLERMEKHIAAMKRLCTIEREARDVMQYQVLPILQHNRYEWQLKPCEIESRVDHWRRMSVKHGLKNISTWDVLQTPYYWDRGQLAPGKLTGFSTYQGRWNLTRHECDLLGAHLVRNSIMKHKFDQEHKTDPEFSEATPPPKYTEYNSTVNDKLSTEEKVQECPSS